MLWLSVKSPALILSKNSGASLAKIGENNPKSQNPAKIGWRTEKKGGSRLRHTEKLHISLELFRKVQLQFFRGLRVFSLQLQFPVSVRKNTDTRNNPLSCAIPITGINGFRIQKWWFQKEWSFGRPLGDLHGPHQHGQWQLPPPPHSTFVNQHFSNMPSVKWPVGFAKVPYQGRPLATPQAPKNAQK